jgi:hypothetical protein
MAVTVTIGRNVEDEPMGETLWADFIDATIHALWEVYDPTVYFSGAGRGFSPEWGEEQSWTFVLSDCDYADRWEALLRRLHEVATTYKQEAIAVTRGETLFVG